MTKADIQRVREFLKEMNVAPLHELGDVTSLRRGYDALAEGFPLLPEATTRSETLAGIAAEWVVPAKSRLDAAILFLHGGGFVAGSPRAYRGLASQLAGAAGVPAVTIDYRLCPEHKFPAAVDDAVAAYLALLAQGFAPERLAFAGDSAGGGLVVAALVRLRDMNKALPAAAVCMSPWVDLTGTARSLAKNAAVDPVLDGPMLKLFADNYLGDADRCNPLASPVFADLTGLPPLLIHVGSAEVLLDDAVTLDARARASGVQSALKIWPGMLHAFQFYFTLLAEGRDSILEMGQFLTFHLSNTKTPHARTPRS